MGKYLGSHKGGDARDEIGIAPYLVETVSQTSNIYVELNLDCAISKNSKDPEVAMGFPNFFFTDEEVISTLDASTGISSNIVTHDLQEKVGLLKGIMKEGYDILARYPRTVLDPHFEGSNVRDARHVALEAYRSGKLSSAEVVKQHIAKQQEELNRLFRWGPAAKGTPRPIWC